MASAYPRGRITPIVVPSAGLTTSVTAYTSGDVLGTQLQFRLGQTDTSQGASVGELEQLFVVDKSKGMAATGVELWLFSSAVTPAADNAALSFSDADMQSLVGIFALTTIYETALNNVAVLNPEESRPIWCGNTGLLYGSLVTRSGNAVFGAVTDLTVIMHYMPEV